jgi:hypothetical protein
MLRRSLLDKTVNGTGLEEMSRLTSEQSLGGARDGLRTHRPTSSLGMDDLGMLGMMPNRASMESSSLVWGREAGSSLGSRERQNGIPSLESSSLVWGREAGSSLGCCRNRQDGIPSMESSSLVWGREAGSSLGCWDRQNGIRGFDFTDEEGGEDDKFGSDLPPTKSPYINSYEEKPWHFPDRNVRKVRFDTYPETRIIDRLEPEECSMVFYGVHELQKMADEYAAEEQQERGNYLASLRLND